MHLVMRCLVVCLAGCSLALHPLAASAQSKPEAGSSSPSIVRRDGQHDFDFSIGRWRTRIARRLQPLSGSDEWAEYNGTSIVRPIWNRRASLGETEAEGPAGHLQALSLRLYNPQSHQWSLNFSNSSLGTMSTPTIGEFKNGRGEFFDQEDLDGRSIYVRFVISDISAHSVRFEQSYSADGGKSWELNWVATDTRAPR